MFRPIVKQAITLSRQSWNGILLVNKLVKVCPSPTHSRHMNRLLKACAGLAVIVLPFSGLPVVCCNKPCCCAEKKNSHTHHLNSYKGCLGPVCPQILLLFR